VFRAYPTRPQEGRAVKLLHDHCDLYNAALEERREAWRMRKASVSYGMQSAQLRDIRKADPGGQGRHSFTAQQQTLRRLSDAFAAFLKRAGNAERNRGKKPGCPRFKPYSRFRQVRFVNGDGAKWIPAGGGGWARATFQAVGSVKVRQHRPMPGMVTALQLKQEHRRWYVIVIAETEPAPLPTTGREVGVDVGIARFLTTSDGQVVDNPRFLAASAGLIADLERRKSRARPGSGSRRRIRRALAREWRKVRNRRRDFHHKTARMLIDECDVIALEDLNMAGMTARTETRPGESGRVPAEPVMLVNPAGTSITCHRCGARCTRPRQDTVICSACGPMDADINGAINIASRAGLGSGQVAPAA
jgi:putative transposase